VGFLRGLGRRAVRRRALRAVVGVCLLSIALLAADLSRPPAHQATSRTALSAIRWYQARVSPHLGGICRFEPTCSEYAKVAIERHGALRGGWMAVKRIARCGPWTPAGTKDLPM
jgi:putative membrane protein insertion efficiency factor